MYAIRSYYGVSSEVKKPLFSVHCVRHQKYRYVVLVGKCIGYLCVRIGGNDKIAHQIPPIIDMYNDSQHKAALLDNIFRITSYNVCYTKLLRASIKITAMNIIE